MPYRQPESEHHGVTLFPLSRWVELRKGIIENFFLNVQSTPFKYLSFYQPSFLISIPYTPPTFSSSLSAYIFHLSSTLSLTQDPISHSASISASLSFFFFSATSSPNLSLPTATHTHTFSPTLYFATINIRKATHISFKILLKL